jgi:type IV pilus assembly protein PilB
VNVVVAQRLARRICPECKEPVEKNPEALERMGFTGGQIEEVTVMRGKGCGNCGNTGYRGRVALYEVMPFTDELKELVLQGGSAAEIKAEMVTLGISTLRMAGINKIIEGVTTPEEVLRTTVED